MSTSLWLSWRDGVSNETSPDGGACIFGPHGKVTFRQLSPVVLDGLRQLAPDGCDESRLAGSVLDAGGAEDLAAWYFVLQRLAGRGLICRMVMVDGRRVVTLVPMSPAFPFVPAPAAASDGQLYLLSRFAYLRRHADRLVLESPLALARVLIDDERVATLIAAVSNPVTVVQLAERGGGLPGETVALVMAVLSSAEMLQPVSSAGEDREPIGLQSWEFHDLLFHTRSRKGRSDAPFGATYRMAGRLEPPAAEPSVRAVDVMDLPQPDLERLCREDVPLAAAVEQRRSLRAYGERPITVSQIGEFLFRVARIRDRRDVELPTFAGPVRMTFVSRPFPSGGALYELEFYVAVNACEGLGAGLYHYDGLHHRLERLLGRTGEVDQLLGDAGASADIPADRVQVVIVLSARFQRLAWKYASIAYALTLKHVGVVYQTMYLTATAMGLAPCALGGGDADLFARATGLDYYTETSVGEFLLGSMPHPA